MTTPPLDVYDVAFLAGGPERVVETAIVVLVRRGCLRVHSPGQLATAGLARWHSVEAAVLDAVGPKGRCSPSTVRWRLADDARLHDVGRRLREAGLVRRGVVGRGAGGRALIPTRAGRKVLADVGELPGVAAEAVLVARTGRSGMTDTKLRADIFEPPDTTPVIPRSRRPSRREAAEAAAYRAGVHGVTGGAGMGGGFGGGFDGGGDGSGS